MNKYIRFGQIPKNGRSVNFMKMTFEQSEDFNYYLENFGHCEKLPDEAGKDLSLHSFYRDEKINIVTGEKKASYLCPFDSAEWVQLQPFNEWTLWGWTFTDPLNGFCG